MEATRVRDRLVPTGEWLMATVFLLATLGVTLLIVRELQTAPALIAPAGPSEPQDLPAPVPPEAVSVSSLLLMDGTTLRVGDGESRIDPLLARASIEATSIDTGALGSRLTRSYTYLGTRFLLVLEPFERRGERRVAGIYLR